MSQSGSNSGGGGGGGTVTNFSFTDANGFAGVVTNPTTTPNLTLTTSVGNFQTIYANSGALTGGGTGTSGQVWTSQGVGVAPIWTTPTTGTVTSVTGTLNRILITGTAAAPIVDISPNYVGQSSITTLGTITTGVWNGTAIGPTFGGTGQTTYATGDILYASAANTLSKLAAGTNGFVLTLAAGIPSWAANGSGDVVGPASATDRAICLYSTTTGKLIQNSAVTSTAAGEMLAGAGSNTNPTYSFSGDTDTGWYSSGSNQIMLAVGGQNEMLYNGSILSSGLATIGAASIRMNLAGNATTPTYSWSGDANTGFFRVGADQLGVSTGGATRATFANALLSLTTSMALIGAATQIQIEGGAVTDFIGTATLASGTVTVANTNIAANDYIMLQRQAANGSTGLGMLTYTISAATSFTITALTVAGVTEVLDTSIVKYVIIRQL